MTDSAKQWMNAWKLAGVALQEEKRRELRAIKDLSRNTYAIHGFSPYGGQAPGGGFGICAPTWGLSVYIEALEDAFLSAQLLQPVSTTSGLVEQQRLFAKART